MPDIRPYQETDQADCLRLLELNTPKYFGAEERPAFVAYLEGLARSFYVIPSQGQVVACGGVECFPGQERAEFRWIMVDPRVHGRGLGRALMLHSIDYLLTQTRIRTITARTSQHSQAFFNKLGYPACTTEVVRDYWAPGLDLYVVQLDLERPYGSVER